MSSEDGTTERLESLLHRGAAGSPGAYQTLLGQAADRLVRLTRKMLRAYPHLHRWEQTDDVFQLAAMRLYRSLEKVQPDSAAAFWGLAATQIRRTLIDLARHHFGPEGAGAHHHSDAFAPAGQSEQLPAAAGAADPNDAEPGSLQEWTDFHEAVDRLPPPEREVFHLIWYAGLPQKVVATELQVSLPTVQRRWYSAQLKLYELLHGHPPAAKDERGS